MNRKKQNVSHGMQGAFVFVLLGLFAVMSTLTVLLGAQMYRGIVNRSADTNRDRVLAAYVRSMIRAGDARGAVSVERYDALPADGAQDGDDGLVDLGDDGLVDFGDDGLADLGGDGLVDLGGDGLVDLGDAPAAEVAGADALKWVLRQAGEAAPEGAADSVCAVAMTETIDGRDYVTWIYQYEGQLRELFTNHGNAFRPGHGTAVCPAKALAATLEGGLMTVRIMDANDRLCTVQAALRCEN